MNYVGKTFGLVKVLKIVGGAWVGERATRYLVRDGCCGGTREVAHTTVTKYARGRTPQRCDACRAARGIGVPNDPDEGVEAAETAKMSAAAALAWDMEQAHRARAAEQEAKAARVAQRRAETRARIERIAAGRLPSVSVREYPRTLAEAAERRRLLAARQGQGRGT